MTAACSTAVTYEVVDPGIDTAKLMAMPVLGSQTERQALARLKQRPSADAVGAAEPSLHLLHGKFPGYPKDAIADGIEGVVDVAYTIDEAGKVREIQVISSPDPRLAAECVAALGRWRYSPPMKGGVAVPVKARQRFPFKLQD